MVSLFWGKSVSITCNGVTQKCHLAKVLGHLVKIHSITVGWCMKHSFQWCDTFSRGLMCHCRKWWCISIRRRGSWFRFCQETLLLVVKQTVMQILSVSIIFNFLLCYFSFLLCYFSFVSSPTWVIPLLFLFYNNNA